MKNLYRRLRSKVRRVVTGRQDEQYNLLVKELENYKNNSVTSFADIRQQLDQMRNTVYSWPEHIYAPFLMGSENGERVLGFSSCQTGGSPLGKGSLDYLAFENLFRGSEELIRQRQKTYLQFFAENAFVLDVGCGRGEFLELAQEAGLQSLGIDINADAIAHCKEKGLSSLECGDVLSYLKGARDRAVNGIFTAQVIEHMTLDYLWEFLRSSYEVLSPGGVFIAETINPHCPEAERVFYLDPTHVKPIFPETLLFLCRNTGFSSAKIFFPYKNSFAADKCWEQSDYAVVAWK